MALNEVGFEVSKNGPDGHRNVWLDVGVRIDGEAHDVGRTEGERNSRSLHKKKPSVSRRASRFRFGNLRPALQRGTEQPRVVVPIRAFQACAVDFVHIVRVDLDLVEPPPHERRKFSLYDRRFDEFFSIAGRPVRISEQDGGTGRIFRFPGSC